MTTKGMQIAELIVDGNFITSEALANEIDATIAQAVAEATKLLTDALDTQKDNA